MIIKCEFCGKEFQFEIINEGWWMVGDCSNTYYEKCPYCNKAITIKTFMEDKSNIKKEEKDGSPKTITR